MSATLEQIEREALALWAKERSQLVDKPWESQGSFIRLELGMPFGTEV